MANPSKSLSRLLDWRTVLSATGADEVHCCALPQDVPCPVCAKGQLRIYDDHVLGGQWASCRDCQFAGDLIELAAGAWQTDIPATLARLEDHGVFPDPLTDEGIAAYLQDHIGYRRRLGQFWEAARLRPMQATESIRNLLRHFGLLDAVQSPMWDLKAGRHIGAASRREIEELFAPSSFGDQERCNRNGQRSVRRGSGSGGRRIFSGCGWGDLLVLPYYDLPGRLCGFLFVGRNADPDSGDWVFKRANLGRSNLPVREAGVAMLSALDAGPDRHFGDEVFVFCDATVGLLLQSQWLRDSSRPLPVVLTHSSPRERTLRLAEQLGDRKAICWGGGTQSLVQAKQCGGMVSDYKISHREVQRRLNHRTPLMWLRAIKKDAVPWQVALRRELSALDLGSAEILLTRMEFTPEQMREFVAGCDSVLRARLEQCDPHRVSHRRIVVSGKSIVETAAGWMIDGTEERLCNAPVRIEEILTTDAGDSYLRGVVPFPHGDAGFTVAKRQVDRRGLFPCVRDSLLEQDAVNFNFQQRWAKRSAFIAMEFHPPQYVKAADSLGWNASRRCFLFPTFSITFGGDVRKNSLPLLIDKKVPARHLHAPDNLSRRHLAMLSSVTPDVSLTWALAACILHNLIAPAMFRKSCGIVLDGDRAQMTGRTVARALGCAQVDLRGRHRNTTILERLNEACCRHGWPAVVLSSGRTRTPVTAEWIDAVGPRNAILSLDAYTAVAVASYPGFFRICCPGPPSPIGELRRAAAAIVPAFLQDACARKLRFESAAEHRVFAIVDDMARWFGSLRGDEAAVRAARQVLFIDSRASFRSLVELVFRMDEAGDIAGHRAGYRLPGWNRPTVVYHKASDGRPATVHVPARQINSILADRRMPVLDLAAVKRSLMERNLLLDTDCSQSDEVWIFSEHWWDEELSKWRKERGSA